MAAHKLLIQMLKRASLLIPLVVNMASADTRIEITLDKSVPEHSRAVAKLADGSTLDFNIGYGRKGFLPEGSVFQNDYTLLGTFRVNAILSEKKFEMAPELAAMSGHKATWLKQNLFKNMSNIDFDGDGKAREYGSGFISLHPLSATKQPFRFGEYKGVYRWFSFAIHGTNDESRIGKQRSGGCINVERTEIDKLVEEIRLGDLVTIKVLEE